MIFGARPLAAGLAVLLAVPSVPALGQMHWARPAAMPPSAPVSVIPILNAAPLSNNIMNITPSLPVLTALPAASLPSPVLSPLPLAAASVAVTQAAVAPVPTAARPALEGLSARLTDAPAAARSALDFQFDAASGHECAACAGEEIPASGVPSAAAPAAPSGRLPNGVAPRRYDLSLSLEPEAGTFRGRVKIALTLSAATDRIVLNALDLNLNEVTVAGRLIDPSKVLLDAKAETATIMLDSPLPKGAASVEISYDGKMNELMRGLFKARGRDEAKKEEAWSFTHLEPTHARRVLPSFDEPEFKAPFALTLDVPEHLTPISNMPAVSETKANGRKVVTFAETPKMSSYLLAVFAARLVPKSRKVGKTVITVWAPADQIGQADFALETAVNALKNLNSYFGLPYQLPKLDLVVSPDFASGAMENWGAILFRDASLLIDPKLSSDAARRRVAEVVTHEIVHQWFGNLVTMKWWNDLWLNEAFATWLAAKIVDQWKPAWKVWDDFDQGKRSPLSIDALPGTRPVRSDAATPAEIQAMFDPMSYQKGGALLRMIEVYLGETAFRNGVRAYIKRYQYKNAEAADLSRELEGASGKPVKKMMDGWLRQGGVPIVSVSASGRTLNLSQERFSAFNLKADTRWSVPVSVTYRLKGERKPRFARILLDKAQTTITLPGKGELLWVYPNSGETGYYRLALDEHLLSLALNHRAELSPIERSGLLNQLWAQVRAGNLPVARFLDALSSFRGDQARPVLEDAAAYLKTIRQELATNDAERAAVGMFAADFFKPALDRLGWDKKKGENPEATLTRPTVLGVYALMSPESVSTEIDARLKSYLTDPASVDPSLAPVVLTAAARRNDPALFDALRQRLLTPKTPEQKDLALRALGEFTAPALLDRSLAMTLTDDVRPQDAWKPFVWLLANPLTQARAWEFVQANWTALVAKVGPRGATRVVGAAGGLISADWKTGVDDFFRAPNHEVEMARKTLDQAVQSIALGLRLRETQGASFAQWARLANLGPEKAAVGLKAYGRLADLWKLSVVERAALLGATTSEYKSWLQGRPMPIGAIERLSLTIRAYRRINEILSAPAANDWIKRPNKAFGGRSALELMTSPRVADLRSVTDYLDGVGGGWL
ncbi:MAG: M1 family aminopeptidase [Elusimicrobiota bacterium]